MVYQLRIYACMYASGNISGWFSVGFPKLSHSVYTTVLFAV